MIFANIEKKLPRWRVDDIFFSKNDTFNDMFKRYMYISQMNRHVHNIKFVFANKEMLRLIELMNHIPDFFYYLKESLSLKNNVSTYINDLFYCSLLFNYNKTSRTKVREQINLNVSIG